MPATQKDIAQKLHISQQLVSYALTGAPENILIYCPVVEMLLNLRGPNAGALPARIAPIPIC